MKPVHPKVLIVSPAFNEIEILPRFVEKFYSMQRQLQEQVELKLLIVNDGSLDGTESLLHDTVAQSAANISMISFASNFGHQSALTIGLIEGSKWADAVITMDCDLEHPFELVPELIQAWSGGKYVVVNTARKSSAQLKKRKRFFSKSFYILASKMTGLQVQPGQADFRLWDGNILRQLISYLPKIGSLRLLAAWLPGPKTCLGYDQHVQAGRSSRFTFKKNLELAIGSIVRFSTLPLKAILALGIIGSALSFTYGLYVIWATYRGHVVPGWASSMLVGLGMGSLQLLALGIIATYLERLVFARDLPRFIVKESRGFLSADMKERH